MPSIAATVSETAFWVAHAEFTDALPIPAGNVQLLIVPGSLTISMQRKTPPGDQEMSGHSMVSRIGSSPPRSPA